MSELFLSVLNMSLTASYVILVVILVRLLLKKAPKIISYALWSVVALRLVLPFSFDSVFSFVPWSTSAVPIPGDLPVPQSSRLQSRLEAVDALVRSSLSAPGMGASANSWQLYLEIGAWIWLAGIVGWLGYSFISILILKRQLKDAQRMEQNIYKAKNLNTPFVLGFIRPRIYLPTGLSDEDRAFILLHEQTHIRRGDPVIKLAAFFILTIHWFNPLVWIAFRLMGTDMELSCDESVLKKMGNHVKKPYANSLLSLAAGRHILNGSPIAFGEGDVKGRIKNILNYKQPRFWVIAVSVIAAATAGIGLLANPDSSAPKLIAGYMVIEDSRVQLDEVEIITTEDTARIEELGLDQNADLPSGYYIHNEDTEKQTFELTNKTTYTFVDFYLLFVTDEDGDRLYTTSNKEEFIRHLSNAYSDSPPAQRVPFFLEVKGGKVISITERFEFTM